MESVHFVPDQCANFASHFSSIKIFQIDLFYFASHFIRVQIFQICFSLKSEKFLFPPPHYNFGIVQCLISWAWNFKICASPLSWISQCWFFSGGSFMLVSFQQLSFPLFPTVISFVLAIVCFQWTCPFSMVISFLLLEESSSWRHMPTDCPAHKSPWKIWEIPPIWHKPLFPQNVFHQIFDITKNVSD